MSLEKDKLYTNKIEVVTNLDDSLKYNFESYIVLFFFDFFDFFSS